MRAYYFDNVPGDQRLVHDSGIPVDNVTLAKIGVLHWHIPVTDKYTEIDAVAKKRGYKNRDVITITKEALCDLYETKLKSFYEDLDGSGFFDVRGKPSGVGIVCGQSISLTSGFGARSMLIAGDLMVLPAGIYHRFTLDEKNVIKATRLFKDEPKWTPHNRGEATDANQYRVDYLKSILVN